MSLQVLMMPMTGLPGPVVGVVADLAQPRAMAERAQVADSEPAMAAEIFRPFAIGHDRSPKPHERIRTRDWPSRSARVSRATVQFDSIAPANSTTFSHFSVSAAMILPKSAGVPPIGTPPSSASRALILRIGQRLVHCLVEHVDDVRRRVLRRAHAEPRARLVALHGLADRRHVRQARRALSPWSPRARAACRL